MTSTHFAEMREESLCKDSDFGFLDRIGPSIVSCGRLVKRTATDIYSFEEETNIWVA